MVLRALDPTIISEMARHCQVVAGGVGGCSVAVGVISAAVNLLSGVGLLAAGVLALVGRSENVA